MAYHATAIVTPTKYLVLWKITDKYNFVTMSEFDLTVT